MVMAGVCRRARRGVAVGSSKGSPGGKAALSMGEVGELVEPGVEESSPLRAGNKSEPIRGTSMTFRGEDRPILKCSSAKKRTEWRIASACMLLGIVGGQKVYLCRCCFSHLHPDNIFRLLVILSPQVAWQPVSLF